MEQQITQLLQTFLGLIVTALVGFISHKVVPIINNKLKSQKNAKIIQIEDMALNFAKNVVAPLAVNATLGNADKRKIAVQKVVAKLDSVGIELPESTVLSIVERAYQLYKANGGDVHKLDVDDSNNQSTDTQTVKVEIPNNQENNGNQAQPNNPYVKGDVNNG